jgi:hypothetical protein
MASLPAFPLHARRTPRLDPDDAALVAPAADPTARAARRLREADVARRATTVAPPSRRRR